jgi:hypothetical protein
LINLLCGPPIDVSKRICLEANKNARAKSDAALEALEHAKRTLIRHSLRASQQHLPLADGQPIQPPGVRITVVFSETSGIGCTLSRRRGQQIPQSPMKAESGPVIAGT